MPARPSLAGALAPAAVAFSLCLATSTSAGADEVPEREVVGLPDAAMVRMTASGPVILYNPALCEAAGAAREFFRAHELGHVQLGHLENEIMIHTTAGRRTAEYEADCYAARRSSPEAVKAMVQLVLRQAPAARDAIYGTKQQRAARILACAARPRA